MNIKVAVKSLGEHANYITKTITAPVTPQNGTLGMQAKFMLLKEVVENPTLSDCGGSSFEKLVVQYNGLAWEIQLSATVEVT